MYVKIIIGTLKIVDLRLMAAPLMCGSIWVESIARTILRSKRTLDQASENKC